MSDALAVVAPKSIEESERLSLTLSKSRLLPEALAGKPSDILATILAGAELGLAPMQSLRGIVIIKGKPTLSADTMGALVKRRRDVCEYLVVRESSDKRATYETKRVGDPSPTSLSFTSDDAVRAKLNGENWQKYPAAMLRARALSAICRSVYPDLCLGLYDPDELTPEPVRSVAKVTPIRESVDAEWSHEPDSVAAAVVSAPDLSEPLRWLEEVTTLAELGALTPRIQAAGVGKDPTFRTAYAARMAALKGGA